MHCICCNSISLTTRVSLKQVFHSIVLHPNKGSSLLMCFCRGNNSYRDAAAEKSIPRDTAHQLNVCRHCSDLTWLLHSLVSSGHPAKSSDLVQGDYGQILEAQV